MPSDDKPYELTVADLDFPVDPAQLGFRTTDELEPLDELVGQPRAMRALELGLGIDHAGYNLYVAGVTGTVTIDVIRHTLTERVRGQSTPPDWVYLNNFDEPDRPLAVSLPAGQGVRLKRDMAELIDRLIEELPKAFRQEDFGREKQRISQQYQERSRELFAELERLAREKGLAVQQVPDGQILFVPLKDDRPMTPEEAEKLSDEETEDIARRQAEMVEDTAALLGRQQEIGRQLSADVREVERTFAARLIGPLVDFVAARYESEELRSWLERLKTDMVVHLDRFRERAGPPQLAMMLGGPPPDRAERFLDYQVNLLVDNSQVAGAPVIVEDAPNYKNLFGAIDRVVDRFGKLVTNFTRIKAGSLLRASGGYLVFNFMDALTEPLVWKELKRTIKTGSIEIEQYDPFAMFTTSSMKPEPIPLHAKVVVLGNPLVYHLLYLYDEDFQQIFKVKADFATEMPRDSDAGRLLGRFVRKLSQVEKARAFQADGVAELVRTAARLVDDRHKLTTEFSRLADVVREASFWAGQEGADTVTAHHVRRALGERVYRSDLIAEKIRELIADGTLLINVDGRVIGQLNGLAVADLGDYAFARPSRLTASVGVGAAGIINIERESRLSGRTFDKAMLILEGYLRNKYAGQHPLALSASLAMEQNYGGVDGDSASVAELVCLLSALAGVPLRQDIAVTGSVNQWGQVQAIGAVNEKIEGFFDVCKEHGLTGGQGVCIPAANKKNVVLRPDVLDALREGKFHVWNIEHVDQALELLGDLPAGDIDQEKTFHGRVHRRLRELVSALKEQRAAGLMRETVVPPPLAPGPPDPRPPLPGEDATRGRGL